MYPWIARRIAHIFGLKSSWQEILSVIADGGILIEAGYWVSYDSKTV
jgi:hypothetical protein